jgi:hypothetical protein
MLESHRTLVSFRLSAYSNCVLSLIYYITPLLSAYIQEIYETFELPSKADLKDAAVKLKEICPPALNTMLTKQTKREALKKRSDRNQIVMSIMLV